jgi:hypothetical protein
MHAGRGFIMAVMYSQVAFNKYAGLWTLNRQDRLATTCSHTDPAVERQ